MHIFSSNKQYKEGKRSNIVVYMKKMFRKYLYKIGARQEIPVPHEDSILANDRL